MKYIIFNNDIPIIFPSSIKHSDIANMIKQNNPKMIPTSAGFYKSVYYIDDGIAYCTGESQSLGLKCGEKDQQIIAIWMKI